LPTLNPEVASFILNTGNYNLLDRNYLAHYDLDNTSAELLEIMDSIIRKKIMKIEPPTEKIQIKYFYLPRDKMIRVEEGILKVESKSINFEMTIYEKDGYYNWYLLTFEHKLDKIIGIDKV
jgi:hypothetical protein